MRGALLCAIVAAGALLVVGASSTSWATDRHTAQPPSIQTLERRAHQQGFTAPALLGNDAIGVAGTTVVIARIGRAWEAAKRLYLGQPQNPAKARELRVVLERWQRRDDQLHGDAKRDGWRIASVRLRLLAPSVKWPGESDRQHRTRIATVLAADRASSTDFWRQVRAAKGKEPSDGVKAVCGVITLGPTVLGAIGSALRLGGQDQARKIREACRQTGKRVQDTTETVAGAVKDVVTDPLGTLAKGVFGPLLKELQKATVYASRQVGIGIDKVASPDLSQRWVRQMLGRAATIAVLIALVAGILGIAHAAITANLAALATVFARACLSGIVGSVVLTVLNVGVAFVDELTTIATGARAGQSGKSFATFADTATKAMSTAEVPSFVALLLLLAMLLGLVVVWWEMWLRAPLLYAVAFFYGPAYSASLFPPARQVLGQLNALLSALVLMPLVVLALLQMAVASLDGQDTITAVLQATGLILLAAASPAILVALFSPSVALSAAAGMAGAFTGGRTALRAGGSAASASLSAAGFAKERLNAARGSRPGSGGRLGIGPDAGGDAGSGGGPAHGAGGGGGLTPSGGAPRGHQTGGPGAGTTAAPGLDGGGRSNAGASEMRANQGGAAAGEAHRGLGGSRQPESGSRERPSGPGDPTFRGAAGSPSPDRGSLGDRDPAASGLGGSLEHGGGAGASRPPGPGLEPHPGGGGGTSSTGGGAGGGGHRGPQLPPSGLPDPPSSPSPGGGPGRPEPPTPRPGMAGLPSPDQPPSTPGDPFPRGRSPEPPRGGGLTPPTP